MKLMQEKDVCCLRIEGEVTVNNSEAFRAHLLQALKLSDLVEIDFEEVTSVDLSGLQLLCSAHRSAAKKGKRLVIRDSSIESLQQAIILGGFSYQQSCSLNSSNECIWKGESE